MACSRAARLSYLPGRRRTALCQSAAQAHASSWNPRCICSRGREGRGGAGQRLKHQCWWQWWRWWLRRGGEVVVVVRRERLNLHRADLCRYCCEPRQASPRLTSPQPQPPPQCHPSHLQHPCSQSPTTPGLQASTEQPCLYHPRLLQVGGPLQRAQLQPDHLLPLEPHAPCQLGAVRVLQQAGNVPGGQGVADLCSGRESVVRTRPAPAPAPSHSRPPTHALTLPTHSPSHTPTPSGLT